MNPVNSSNQTLDTSTSLINNPNVAGVVPRGDRR